MTATPLKDPVCDMDVDPNDCAGSWVHEGHTYYFCSEYCLHAFSKDPQRYLSARPPLKPGDSTATYTCPMDPEIRQVGPGACPKCGMALEPLEVLPPSPHSKEANPELREMTWRFWIAALFAIPLFVLAMALPHDHTEIAGAPLMLWLQFALATPAVLGAGYPLFVRGVQSVRFRHLNMFTLIALGTGIAYLYSVAVTVLLSLHIPSVAQGVYFEPAAMIVTLVLLGQVLELRARGKTGDAIRALLGQAPPSRAGFEPMEKMKRSPSH